MEDVEGDGENHDAPVLGVLVAGVVVGGLVGLGLVRVNLVELGLAEPADEPVGLPVLVAIGVGGTGRRHGTLGV